MDHFGDGSNFGVKLEYFIEQTPLGTAGSVKMHRIFLMTTLLLSAGTALQILISAKQSNSTNKKMLTQP